MMPTALRRQPCGGGIAPVASGESPPWRPPRKVPGDWRRRVMRLSRRRIHPEAAGCGEAVSMRLRSSIRALLLLVVVAALGSCLYRFGARIESRLRKELANVILVQVGVPGFNSSGRPGDDPYWDIREYPPILLSCLFVGSVLALIGIVAGVRARRRRARVGGRSGPTAA